METDRVSKIKVGDKEYELILTTKATKEIAGRYGGLENLGDKLMKAENFEMALGEIVWLICLLANQSILIHNIKNKDNQKDGEMKGPGPDGQGGPEGFGGTFGNRNSEGMWFAD